MIIHGDCIAEMAKMEPCSIDAVVTDAPYALSFMQKAFDSFESPSHYQSWTTSWATEALRVLKPGGSMLCFGGTRTFHRLTCGLEDAGFIIKDCLNWIYASGFPKAQDAKKMVEKRGGNGDHLDGYKIGGIKPAWEPIIWAVKPPEGAWIDNCLKYGVGAVNVDECRIGMDSIEAGRSGRENQDFTQWRYKGQDEKQTSKGRFPANLILDESAGALLDEQSGVLTRQGSRKIKDTVDTSWFGADAPNDDTYYGDTGGASRFFYCSKANKREPYNDHPTLKPVKLMEHLVRLVTRPGQLVLDPFAGSGTTGVSCIKAGRAYLLIEQDSHYVSIAKKRLAETEPPML